MRSHILGGIAFLAAAFLGFSLAIMLLWNALIPDLLGLPAIAFYQAMGLLVLSRLLFGGIGCGHKHMGHGKRFRDLTPLPQTRRETDNCADVRASYSIAELARRCYQDKP